MDRARRAQDHYNASDCQVQRRHITDSRDEEEQADPFEDFRRQRRVDQLRESIIIFIAGDKAAKAVEQFSEKEDKVADD